MKHLTKFALAGCISAAGITAAQAENLLISASLPQVHFWVGKHMDPFADAIEKATNGEVSFTRFYAGELTSVGRELDALQGGAVDVAAPLLAPYHEGAFPLSDVTQLPTLKTTAITQTKAFLDLMASDVALKDGKTFYQYEIAPKNIHAWPVATTAAYAINFAKVKPTSADALKRDAAARRVGAAHDLPSRNWARPRSPCLARAPYEVAFARNHRRDHPVRRRLETPIRCRT